MSGPQPEPGNLARDLLEIDSDRRADGVVFIEHEVVLERLRLQEHDVPWRMCWHAVICLARMSCWR